MATITIHKPADVQLVVVDGDPPVDQTELVADLRSEIIALNVTITNLQAKIDTAKAALA